MKQILLNLADSLYRTSRDTSDVIESRNSELKPKWKTFIFVFLVSAVLFVYFANVTLNLMDNFKFNTAIPIWPKQWKVHKSFEDLCGKNITTGPGCPFHSNFSNQ